MVTFKRIAPRLYVEAAMAQDVGRARVAFVPLEALANDSIDPISTIDQGCFLLFPEQRNAQNFIAQAVAKLDKANGDKRARIATFDRNAELRTGEILRCNGVGRTFDPNALQFGRPWAAGGEPATGNGRWRLTVDGATLDTAGDSLVLRFGARAANVGFRVDSGYVPFAPGERHIALVIGGPKRGLWTFGGALNKAMVDGFGIGPRYFSAKQQGVKINISEAVFPLLDFTGVPSARFGFELDCAQPHAMDAGAARSRLLLPSTELPSHLLSVHGHRLLVKPAAGASLSLIGSPTVLTMSGNDPILAGLEHQLTPSGAFELHADGKVADEGIRLALGASNLESIALRPGAGGDLLHFALGAALVKSPDTIAIGPLDATFTAGSRLADLDGYFATAWLQVGNQSRGGAPHLAIDPEGMQSYAPDKNLMRFSPSKPRVVPSAIPWVPVLGLGDRPGAGAAELAIERQFLSQTRRELFVGPALALRQKSVETRLAGQTDLRTPQGYAVTRDSAGWPASVTFTRTSPRTAQPGLAGEQPDFGLVPANSDGEALLAQIGAANRLCLITRMSKLVRFFTQESLLRLYMADWRVGWTDAAGMAKIDPIVILKHDNRSLEALASDPSQWINESGPLALSDTDRAAVRSFITATIARTGDLYKPIKRRLQSSDWNGLLLTELHLAAMPPQLGALETLLTDALKVHHIGVDLSAIDGGDTRQWKTAIFGLVDFEPKDGEKPPFRPDVSNDPAKDTIQLRLDLLKLQVENDAVRHFSAKITTRILGFLDTPAKGGQDMALLGRYESRVTETGERRDSYLFEIEPGLKPITFDNDRFLKQIEIKRVGLLTEYVGQERRGKLLIDGALSFHQVGGELDLLGIDRLEFADLGAGFGLEAGKFVLAIGWPSLRFDFGGFNSRDGKSKPRDLSFLGKLPIKLRGFRFGEFDLGKIGYINFAGIGGVDLVSDFRFAFDFDIDLGSLGALGKKLDRFKLNILMGWRPAKAGGGKNPSLALGFRIDAGDGVSGIDIGIEGIIRLTADRFRVTSVKAPYGETAILLAADKARLKLFSIELPSKSADLSFYLFAPLGKGQPIGEKVGWYARLKDKDAKPPVKIDQLALGQRVLLDFDKITTTRETLDWLDKKQTFETDQQFIDFAGGPGKVLSYAPNREWFVAMAGEFLELFKLQLLLRDPDLYGIYFALLDQDALSVDLLYQKLSDGVGLYTGEFLLPAYLRRIDLGAAAITIGAIRVTVGTRGEAEINFGFPEDLDYGRSFAIQAGPFLGKGGFYIGWMPGEALPKRPGYPLDKVFRMGFALRLGLGREVIQGPMSASLSASVFGRLEGYIARTTTKLAPTKPGNKALVKPDYYIWVEGEVGIILELEGRVDLKLVQARLLVRAWIAVGVTLETARPIVLYGRMGVHVSLLVVIGRIKVFGKKIEIRVRVGYDTELRYEWVLPAKMPALLAAGPRTVPWSLDKKALAKIGAAAPPFALKILLDISRSTDGGARAVLIPSAFLYDVGKNQPHPLAALGEAFIRLAVQDLKLDPDTISLRRADDPAEPGDLAVETLRAQLAELGSVPLAKLDALFTKLFPQAEIDIATGGARGGPTDAFAFPIPPGLKLELGGKLYDFAKLGSVSAAELDKISAGFARQFAGTSAKPAKRTGIKADPARPIVEHLFQSWCQLFALTCLETMQKDWDSKHNAIKLTDLLGDLDWRMAAQRAGRAFHGGLRIATAAGSQALVDRAGLMLDVPTKDADIRVAAVQGSAWLKGGTSQMTLLSHEAALIGTVDPAIKLSTSRPSAISVQPRAFVQSPPMRLEALANGQESALFVPFSENICSVLHRPQQGYPALDHRIRPSNTTPGDEVTEIDLVQPPKRSLSIALTAELVRGGRDKTAGDVEPIPGCIHIMGASERQRRPLDALLAGGEAGVAQRLAKASAFLAVGGSGKESFAVTDLAGAGAQLARATSSVERRPGPAMIRGDDWKEDIFLADGTDLADFLCLTQRAAIVNSGGTYLLLPPQSPLFRRFAADPELKLSLIILFDDAAAIPASAVNGACLFHPYDRKALQQLDKSAPRRLVTRPAAASDANTAPYLHETVSLREPGSVLIRVLRDKPGEPDNDQPTPAHIAQHLASQFDMLEFGVEVDGQTLLAIDQSVPVASMEALPSKPTAAQKADLEKCLTNGLNPADLLRYDLLVPLWRLIGAANPYAAVDGRAYRVRLGWRDIYGNRLDSIAAEETVTCLYQDALLPLEAWPGVRAWATAGQPGSLFAKFAFVPPSTAMDPTDKAMWRRDLQRLIHQLEGPGVTLRFETRLGQVGQVANFPSQLVTALMALLDGKAPKPLTIKVPVVIDDTLAHQPLELRLGIERAAALCDRDAPEDVRRTSGFLPLRPQGVQGDEDKPVDREAQLVASQFATAYPTHRAARGAEDDGSSSWWAVDLRLIPAVQGDPALYGQPPLARAPMSATGVPFKQLQADGAQLEAQVDIHDADSDALMQGVLDKIDAFLAPPLASLTARSPANAAGDTPFERVMRTKRALLEGQDDATLLQHLAPVYAGKPDLHQGAARRSLREAMATDLSRFYESAAVVVQPLDFSKAPPHWLATGGPEDEALKIYGQLRFGGRDGASSAIRNAIRALSHGIPLRGPASELAFTVLTPAGGEAREIDLTAEVAFEVTHVERAFADSSYALASGPKAIPSRWLSFVPIDGAQPLPVIDVSNKKKIVAPAPLRRLPKPPRLDQALAAAAPTSAATGYKAAIVQARSWRFDFGLGGIETPNDEACGRLIYNAAVGSSPMPTVQTPAQPLFPGLFAPLAGFDRAMETVWPAIAGAASGATPAHFDVACTMFADQAEALIAAFTAQPVRGLADPVDEDRFVLHWQQQGEARFAFADHVPSDLADPLKGDPKRKPLAGDGAPIVHLGYAATALDAQIGGPDYAATFKLPGKVGQDFAIGLWPLNAVRLNSIWAAASIRRNKMIDNKIVNPRFVYRTAEVYLQEALVPRLKVDDPIPLGNRPAESLTDRLTAALSPLFDSDERALPVQIRLGLESIRLAAVTAPKAKAADQFLPEPDPKVQLVTELQKASVASVAQQLGIALTKIIAHEPIGSTDDVRLILSITVLSRDAQPLLDLPRIQIPLAKLNPAL